MSRLWSSILLVLALVVPVAVPACAQTSAPGRKLETATFAGGCFWCLEADFDALDGIVSTVSGYMGGITPNPTYEQVTRGKTGHREVVQIMFDPAKVTYRRILEYYWRHVDPYDAGGQFCDRGDPYKPAIFVHSAEQKRLALDSRTDLEKNGPLKRPLATLVTDAMPFTPAEDYHQDFYKRNPFRYLFYRHGCGRDARIESIWGKKVTQ